MTIKLFNAGLITPKKFHYVRNYGAVPRLFWETHRLKLEGKLDLSMDVLADRFNPINIPVARACDGICRGELSLVKKSKGFTWGAAAVSSAYWRGVLPCDVHEAAGSPQSSPTCKCKWINFEGADQPSEGKYSTYIPLDYAINRSNDFLLAYEINNVKLPPDHGYPVRFMIPGYAGGRCVKWLSRIRASNKENDSFYHVWDDRVLPSFITEKDGEFACNMFHHPSTACNEQNLNSAIVRPAQDEKFDIAEILKQDTYRVEGYAYDGGRREVQRVELSPDESQTWLYWARNFPNRPVRHGKKFWTWLYWHNDIDTAHAIDAKFLTVHCFNIFKNTQTERGVWNTVGMMINGWYKVKPTLESPKA
jgi:nitrate reductase (NAD(P)H)